MGVQITEILPRRQIEITELAGKKIAIDAFNWLYQFLSIIRQPDGTPLMDSQGRITSHLSGLFYRTAKLVEAGIKPVYVFDGKPPEFKFVLKERSERKEEARLKWAAALEAGEIAEAKKHAMMSTRLSSEMIAQAKQLLKHMGIPVVQAPSEGEAECAYLCKEGSVFATASQDADSLLFGSLKLVKNLSISGKRKLPKKSAYVVISPEMIELKAALAELGINREQLIMIGMLVGTDFNEGIKGIGPKKALAAVKDLKSFEKIAEKFQIEDGEKIYEFFLNPPAEDAEISFSAPDTEKIRGMLVDEFEFSDERIAKSLETLSKEKPTPGLGKWVKK